MNATSGTEKPGRGALISVSLAERLREEGLKLDDLLASIPREVSHFNAYTVLETLAVNLAPPIFATELARRRLAECEAVFAETERLASAVDPTAKDAGCISQLVSALRSREPSAYEKSLAYARRLHSLKPLVTERKALLDRLHLVAPVWAEHLANRTAEVLPGDVGSAWLWRQLNDELEDRDSLNANEIQRKIDELSLTLREITQWLIDAKSWGKQLERLQQNHVIRQSLVGWLDTMKVLISTRQPDHRQQLLSEARKLMRKCVEAVPVWIMPISIVAESFDPRTTRFDVVILDEASQADLNALIPLYLGKQVVIVGDHEQVTPLGVGQDQTMLDNLRKQVLIDIPNSHLFDAKFSIYDIGRQSFGDGIRLIEHFRCVPEIIGFSNQLSYEGKIRPLRESNSSDLKPACVSVQVPGFRENDINKAEARRIVDLIKAMIAHPRYAEKTIGVIAMMGDKQTLLIQSLILKEILGIEIEKRRIQAGNSSEFQGDERDVILLSLVDSPEGEGPMRLTREGAFELVKKRYNVAASRARDQMFVVHSMDYDLHLKPGDLRRLLLQHVRNPLANQSTYTGVVGKTESPFERAVLRRLTDAGYRVQTQWQVGYYRIDMVVEGGGKRLAVECDGDRFHPIEKLAEDIERQTILERLGWQFVRIRGSAFYRNADAAMSPLFERLEELEISREANAGPPIEIDLSLIHELDDLIKQGFDGQDTIPYENWRSDEGMAVEGSDDLYGGVPSPGEMHEPALLLKQMGGIAALDTVLRELAKARGFHRLGKNVREQLQRELNDLAKQEIFDITNGVIRLIKK